MESKNIAKGSYKNIRRFVGVLGILLPIICILGGSVLSSKPLLLSLSGYYYSNMRDIFVGVIFSFCLLLITYEGYTVTDSLLTTISGIFGLGVAIFPCQYADYPDTVVGIFQLKSSVSGYIHTASALIFFILLAINSIFLFTKSNSVYLTKQKIIRNMIYRVSGVLILATIIVGIILYFTLSKTSYDDFHIILLSEIIMLISFGLSWLVKGETIFRD